MYIRPVTKCQTNFNEIADICRYEREPVFITKNGYEDLVLMRAQDYEQSIARLELYDKLAAAQHQIDTGESSISHEELFFELRQRMTERE